MFSNKFGTVLGDGLRSILCEAARRAEVFEQAGNNEMGQIRKKTPLDKFEFSLIL